MDSILDSVKKVLGIDKDYDVFDVDILMHINSVFATLNQLGVGPEAGYSIEDASPTWSDYLGDDLRLNNVKTYVYLRVRMLFDPPTTSYLLNAYEKQIQEAEWRINVTRESETYTPPEPVTTVEPEVLIIPSSQAWYSE